MQFTYGENGLNGVPIVVIVPEDSAAQNLDPGARDYVEHNMSSFIKMAESSNDAANKYTWFQSFLLGLSNGAMVYPTGRSRTIALGSALDPKPGDIDSCLPTPAPGQPTPDPLIEQTCIYGKLTTLAPTTLPSDIANANLLGIAATTVLPAAVTPYVTVAAAVMKLFGLFGLKGRANYEYLPATLYPEMIGPTSDDVANVLQPIAPPGVRPNATISDVIFFTIGAPDQANQRPNVVYTGDAALRSSCANDDKIVVPFSLDKASLYVHDAGLSVRPLANSLPVRTLQIDQRDITSPVIYREHQTGSEAGAPYLDDGGASAYEVALNANYGFDTVKQGAVERATIAVPRKATWQVEERPVIVGGQSPTVLHIKSINAPCLEEVDLVQGRSIIQAITGTGITHADSETVQFSLNLNSGVVPGNANLVFVQHDRVTHNTIKDEVPLNLASAPTANSPPIAYLGDGAIFIKGSALDNATGVSLDNRTMYVLSSPNSTATGACFTGPSFAGFSAGHTMQGNFISSQAAGPFVLTIDDARPKITSIVFRPTVTRQVMLQNIPSNVILSTDWLTLDVTGMIPSKLPMVLPATPLIALRPKSAATGSPCESISASLNLTGPQLSITPPTLASAYFRPTDLLGSRAAGPIQVQLIDKDAATGSNWVDVPGLTLTPAPDIESVSCSKRTGYCTMTGTQFASIAQVIDENGASAIVGMAPNCTPNKECLLLNKSPKLKLRVEGVKMFFAINPKMIVETDQ